MGKLEFDWNEEELVIKQCDKMKDSPHECDACRHRFYCYTERIKSKSAKISSKHTTHLSDIIKAVDRIGTD